MSSYIKKLILAPFFLLLFSAFYFFLKGFIEHPNLILSLDRIVLLKLIYLSVALILSGVCYAVLISMVMDFKATILVILFACLLPFLFFSFPIAIVFSVGSLVSFLIVYPLLENKLKNYLTFEPATLTVPSIKTFTMLMLIVISFGFYLANNREIEQKGFEIPEVLIDAALNALPQSLNLEGGGSADILESQLQITPDQLNLLKNNPQVLKQYGVTPEMLKSFEESLPKDAASATDQRSNSGSFLKQTIKNQLAELIKPYRSIIAIVLAVIFFFTLSTFTSIIGISTPIIVWSIFYVLERLQIIGYTTEMRSVKKMVV